MLDAKPVIFNVSDAVTAGTSFNINGSGFTLQSLVVAVEFDTNGISPSVPDISAAYCSILVTDKLSNFVIAQMPNLGTNGVFNLWVGNSTGWSTPVKLNVARPLYISDYQTFSNETIEVVGRNFLQSEFNGQGITMARLNSGGGTITNATILNCNPYHMTLLISNQPIKSYYVEVSNDSGTNWTRLASGQQLQNVSYPVANYTNMVGTNSFDPLGLGVCWAKDFNWANVYDVTKHGIVPNSTNDCTAQVQSLLNQQATNGGVLYFPAGSYYFKGINLAYGNVIEGAGAGLTTFYYIGGNKTTWINSRGTNSIGGVAQLQGLANLTLKLNDNVTLSNRPDIFISLGDTSPFSVITTDQTTRTANRIFVSGVNMSYPYNNGDSKASDGQRGVGMTAYGKERMLVQNCNWSGWYAGIDNSCFNNYFIFRNNSFEYTASYTLDTANYAFFETNTLNIHNEFNQSCHGLDGRANSYFAGNYVNGAGDLSNTNNNSDGEGIFCEAPNGSFNYGKVVSATSNTITVAPATPLINPNLYYGTLSVLITYGTGMGQMLPVTGINTNTSTITVSSAFKVTPDATSVFSLYAPLNNFTVYANTVTNCVKGIWPFGNQFDTVVADNTVINCNGIFVWACRSGPPNGTIAADYDDDFVRICRNNVSGYSRRSHQGGIGLSTGRYDCIGFTGNFYDAECYGTQIVSNTVTGNSLVAAQSGTEAPYYSGIYLSSYPYSTLSNGTGTGDITDSIIEGNTLNNLQFGMTVTTCNYGEYIDNNYCAPLVQNIMLINNLTAKPTDNMLIAPQ